MNKRELIDAVAATSGVRRKDAAAIVDAVVEVITGALVRREAVGIAGFGAFEARPVAARTARNPKTGAAVEVPAHHRPAFRAGGVLKDAVA